VLPKEPAQTLSCNNLNQERLFISYSFRTLCAYYNALVLFIRPIFVS